MGKSEGWNYPQIFKTKKSCLMPENIFKLQVSSSNLVGDEFPPEKKFSNIAHNTWTSPSQQLFKESIIFW